MSIQSMIMSNNKYNVQLLLEMLHKDDPKKLLEILNKYDDETGDTPLISALRVGNWDIVTLLMKYGADPMAENKEGEIPARIKSPIRTLFISEYLNRTPNQTQTNGNTESLFVVASEVLISSLNSSLNTINDSIDSCQFKPQCLNCKNARATVYHKSCKHLVLCDSCCKALCNEKDTNEDELIITIKCPFCNKEDTNKEFIQTEYVIINNIKLDFFKEFMKNNENVDTFDSINHYFESS